MSRHDGPVRGYPVGDVARLAGVSVRTLHHYDRIGLLTPSGRSTANYRLYSPDDLDRLRQILFYRELGFSLDDIAEALTDIDTDDRLRRQHRLLRERQARTQALLDALEREMRARRMGIALSPEEQLDIFGTELFSELAAEAERRWGDTGPDQAPTPTAAHTRDDWLAIKAEADANVRAFAAALAAGEPATGPIARRAAEQHRAHLSRWFHPCSHERHRAVAAVYLSAADAWEQIAPGFAQYVHDAIVANAEHADPQAPRPC